MTSNDPPKARWFDTTVNVQTLLILLISLLLTAGGGYYGVVGRLTVLEYKDTQQELHFSRIEVVQAEQRTEARDSLKTIGQDIKELSGKFDTLNYQMGKNSAGSRPETQRWTK